MMNIIIIKTQHDHHNCYIYNIILNKCSNNGLKKSCWEKRNNVLTLTNVIS